MTREEFEALVIRHLRAIGAAYQEVYPNSPYGISVCVNIDKKEASCWAYNDYWQDDNVFPLDIYFPTFGDEEDKKEAP